MRLILFLPLTIIMIYLAATFFLLPYYSVIGRVKDYEPKTYDLTRRKHLITLKTSTSIQESPENYIIQASFFSDTTTNVAEGDVCPNKFQNNSGSPLSVQPCVQNQHLRLQFIAFQSPDVWGPDDVNSAKSYFVERSVQLHELTMDLRSGHLSRPKTDGPTPRTKHVNTLSTEFQIHLLRICSTDGCECDRSQTATQSKQKCQKFLDNLWESQRAAPHKNEFENDTLGCYDISDIGHPVCAVGVRIGPSVKCLNDQNAFSSECRFTLRLGLYIFPPTWLTFGSVWTWGVIGFVSTFTLWSYIALYYGRLLHLNYLQNYYAQKLPFSLKSGREYKLTIFITGEQYSKRTGVLELGSRKEVFKTIPLHIRFEEEDEEGSKSSTVVLHDSYYSKGDHSRVEFHIRWTDEFHMAGFIQPSVQVVLQQEMPPFVKTRFNLFFMPFFLVFKQAFNKSVREMFIEFDSWLFLCAYFASVHLAILVVLVYTFAAFTRNEPEVKFQ
eukprot:c20023_g1_i1.p1 GENE.c20023_g1_i1~~c20023_g1_i1.p1  ORF type:complete len:497 (+),score=157.25 c20023_g1_i1:693-2183(+)